MAYETTPEERKKQVMAMLASVGLHGALALLFFFLVAWREPNPPLGLPGIEIQMGFSAEGSGEVQPLEPTGNDGTESEAPNNDQPEEATPESEPVPDDVKPVDPQPVSKEESPVVVKEKEEVKTPTPEKPVDKKTEPKKEPEKPKVNDATVYKPKSESSNTSDKAKAGKPGNEGDDTGKTGDKGQPDGDPNGAYNGPKGPGGGGVSMSGFNGFTWPKVPTPALPDDANGVYEFLVKVDADGNVTSVKPLQRGLSLEAERRFKQVIERLEFTPKGVNLPEESEGKIVFRVVSK